MSRKLRIWLTATLGFVTYLVLVKYVPSWIGVTGRNSWILFGSLGVLGAVGFLFSAIFLGKRVPAPPPPKDPLSVQLDEVLTQAQRKLIEARVARGAVFQKLPAVFVLGPRQHHKTSAVIRSGINAELLAGDVLRGGQVVPTQTANVWYAGGALIAEVGTDVVQEPERWNRLLHRFQPARLSLALTHGEQAPRAVLVCFSCEALRRPGGRDAVIVAARELRASIGEIARAYGIRLPVYVLFTKADDIPGFKEYVRRFTGEEARDVLGATLPVAADTRAADYADRAAAVIRGEFRALFERLAARRADVLSREDAAGLKPAIYQFPRELRKLEPLIVEFLGELGRPSDLQTSAFVRGFYFSGVREHLAGDAAPAQPAAAGYSPDDASGATSLLRPVPQPASAPAPKARSAARREAQWVFLDRLFSLVVLNDAVALGMTRGGTRVSFFRRAAAATALAVAVLFGIAVISSFVVNRRLQDSTKRAIAYAAVLPTTAAAAPTNEQLRVLDSLGAVVDTLSGHVNGFLGGITVGFGLSQTRALYDAARRMYFDRFERLMLDSTRRTMVSRLTSLPDTPLSADQFTNSYARLKAYLITTTYPESTVTMDSLAGVLRADWPPAAQFDTSGQQLAQRQFGRYAGELKWQYPFRVGPVEAAVQHARAVLQRSGGEEQIYQAIFTAASRASAPIRLPGPRIVSVLDIHPAFTRFGRDSVKYALDTDIDRYLQSEAWVLGEIAAVRSEGDRDRLRSYVRRRYDSAYVDHWRKVLRSARVTGFSRPADTYPKLRELASNNSPLLFLFAAANENLLYDSLATARSFGPLKQVGAPKLDASRVTDAMKPYLDAVQKLATKIEALAAPAATLTSQQITDALDAAGDVRSSVEAIGLNPRDQVADLGIETLLRQPADLVKPVIEAARRGLPPVGGTGGGPAPPSVDAKPLNDGGRAFCADFRELAAKRPLTSSGSSASLAEFGRILAPESGRVWTFGTELGAVLQRRGAGFADKPNTELTLNPDALAFMRALASITDALYPSGTAQPQLQWQIAPDLAPGTNKPRSVTLKFGANADVIFGNQAATAFPTRVTWNPAVDQAIAILNVGGVRGLRSSGMVKEWQGPWAPLQFFGESGNWTSAGGDSYSFTVDIASGVPLLFRVTMSESVRGVVRGSIFRLPECPEWWVRAK